MSTSVAPALTTVQRHGEVWLKRDDLFISPGGASGGKARTCLAFAQGATRGLVTAGSRSSPQVNIVARIGHALGLPVRAHVPAGKPGPEVEEAEAYGAEIEAHRPGYNSVICARAEADAEEREWTYVPFGMETQTAVEQTAAQVENIPDAVERVVIAVGSGMSLAGVLAGLRATDRRLPILGVVVGADPTRRLDTYAPFWATQVELVAHPLGYGTRVDGSIGGVTLDPIYEAKCLAYLRAGDLLWIVGLRPSMVAGT